MDESKGRSGNRKKKRKKQVSELRWAYAIDLILLGRYMSWTEKPNNNPKLPSLSWVGLETEYRRAQWSSTSR